MENLITNNARGCGERKGRVVVDKNSAMPRTGVDFLPANGDGKIRKIAFLIALLKAFRRPSQSRYCAHTESAISPRVSSASAIASPVPPNRFKFFRTVVCGAIEKNCNRIGVFFQLAIVELAGHGTTGIQPRSLSLSLSLSLPPLRPPPFHPLPPGSLHRSPARYRISWPTAKNQFPRFFPPARRIRRQHHRRFHRFADKAKKLRGLPPMTSRPCGVCSVPFSQIVPRDICELSG